MADERLCVLILGGWSRGPLDFIEWTYRTRCEFIEPSLHMPPHGVRWCGTWECGLLVTVIALALWLLTMEWDGTFLPLPAHAAAFGAALLLVPVIIVLLVRGSIRRSVAAAERVIRGRGVDVVVGFSWGGGIGCFLLNERRWRGPTLLLAPTLSAMASAARLAPLSPRPFFRARGAAEPCVYSAAAHAGTSATPLPPTAAPCAAAIDDDDDAIDDAPPSLRPLPTVHIVHASHDGFCPPSQERELSLSGATMHRVRDVHIFTERRSEEAIGRAFEALLGEAAQTRAARGQGCRQGAHVRR